MTNTVACVPPKAMDPAAVLRTLLLTTALAFTWQGQAQAATQVHVVRQGDTLWGLSKHTGCSVAQLRRANAGTETLHVGDRLRLPCRTSRAKPRPKSAAGASHTVTVRNGDTLSHIAKRHHTTPKRIRQLNRLSARSLIMIGQVLRMPSSSASSPVTTQRPRVVRGQSIGKPHRGKLVSGVQLPHSSAYFRRRPSKAYGAQHTIDYTRNAIEAVRRKYPKVHRLAIGDISSRRGGALSGHRSHQSGRDVDVGLYFKRRPTGYPKAFVSARASRVDLAATWALVELLAKASSKAGGPEYIFLDYKVQGQLHKYARSKGVSKAKLGKIFQYAHGRSQRVGLVRHEPNHADHLHIRYRCAPKDRKCG